MHESTEDYTRARPSPTTWKDQEMRCFATAQKIRATLPRMHSERKKGISIDGHERYESHCYV